MTQQFHSWVYIRKQTNKQTQNTNLKNTCTLTFIALFIIAKIWKQPKCPLTDEWIKKMEYYSAIKKDENLPFAATWIDLEGIMVSEISQKEKDKYCMLSLTCGI